MASLLDAPEDGDAIRLRVREMMSLGLTGLGVTPADAAKLSGQRWAD
jgi:hypothetical protein